MATIRRRQVLLLGALTLTATACTPDDPAVRGGAATPPGSSIPAPTPPQAHAAAGAQIETALAGQATALLCHRGPSGGLRDRLELVRVGHLTHALALSGPQPTLRPATPTPPPPVASCSATPTPAHLPALPGGWTTALDAYRDQLGGAAATYADHARSSTGSTALLWGSLAVSARMAAAAVDVDPASAEMTPPPTRPPAPLPRTGDVAAASQLLSQLHAVVFGYRAALAALGGSRRARAAADLRARMRSRDALVDWLVSRPAAVPAAEPAYDLGTRPSTTARAGSLISRMESALLPFAGQWLAACDDPSRRAALDGLGSAAAASVFWGGPPRTWPGWPD